MHQYFLSMVPATIYQYFLSMVPGTIYLSMVPGTIYLANIMTPSCFYLDRACEYGFNLYHEERLKGLPKVIFLGITENNQHHLLSVAALLNKVATTKDLLLVEYLERGKKANANAPLIDKSDTINVLALLKLHGLQKNMTVEGWDNTSFKSEIVEMSASRRPFDYEILIGKRNESLINAVEDNYSRYNRIWALAGALHYCVPPSDSFPADLKLECSQRVNKYHQRLKNRFSPASAIIVPKDKAQAKCSIIPMLIVAAMVCAFLAFSGMLRLHPGEV